MSHIQYQLNIILKSRHANLCGNRSGKHEGGEGMCDISSMLHVC